MILTLAEVKQFMRIDSGDTSQDITLTTLIQAVQSKIELQTNAGFEQLERTFKWDGSRVQLPFGPVVSVQSIDPETDWQLVGDTLTGPTAGVKGNWWYSRFGYVEFTPETTTQVPTHTVIYTSGYAEVPASIKTAALALIDHIYYSRGTISDPLPEWVNKMVEIYSRNYIL